MRNSPYRSQGQHSTHSNITGLLSHVNPRLARTCRVEYSICGRRLYHVSIKSILEYSVNDADQAAVLKKIPISAYDHFVMCVLISISSFFSQTSVTDSIFKDFLNFVLLPSIHLSSLPLRSPVSQPCPAQACLCNGPAKILTATTDRT